MTQNDSMKVGLTCFFHGVFFRLLHTAHIPHISHTRRSDGEQSVPWQVAIKAVPRSDMFRPIPELCHIVSLLLFHFFFLCFAFSHSGTFMNTRDMP